MDKIIFHIIPHTHWDREWYFPFETFRIELTELIDNLLDILKQNKDFKFHLDGQSVIIEDYLEINPEKKDLIKNYIKSDNLLIGPWYVLSDQFLTSSEATIRNLIYGIKYARDFGNVMLIGYLPDQFGQIAQLPQILRGFNISSTVIGRGIQDKKAEHRWYGLNGEDVTAVSLTHWYNNAQVFPKDNIEAYLDKIYENQSKTSLSGHILLMNGCDHLFAQKNLKDALKNVNGNKKYEIKISTLTDALKKISENQKKDDFPIIFGELRDDNNKFILAGTLSSRMYLKLENYKCQTKIEKIIEPLSVIYEIADKKDSLKILAPLTIKNILKYAWKLLIKNHAHDSICGCSTDDVHKEMETRFLKINHVLEKLKEDILSPLCSFNESNKDRQFLQVINLTNYKRSEPVETEIEFLLGSPANHPGAEPQITKKEVKSLILKNKDKTISVKILKSEKTYKLTRSIDEVPLLQSVQKTKVLFHADIEPFSVISYKIEPVYEDNESLKEEVRRFENKFYELFISKDGTLNLKLKDSGFVFNNIHFFTIEGDSGNEYEFVSDKNSKTISSKEWKWNHKVTEENSLRKIISISSETNGDLKVNLEITCYSNLDRIDIKTIINNKNKNKRIRLHFPTQLNTCFINADTQFGTLCRALPPCDWINYSSTQPIYNWIDHSNENQGLAFIGGGLSEYELYPDGNGFAVTMLRSVGKLSAVKSMSLIDVPDAQCNRTIEYSYAIIPHTGSIESANIAIKQLNHQTPVLLNQSFNEINSESVFRISNELILSALKKGEDKDSLIILRLYNPTRKALKNCELSFSIPVKNVYLMNLNEEVLSTLKFDKNKISFDTSPFQVITFGIEF